MSAESPADRRCHTRHELSLPVFVGEREGRTRDLSAVGAYFFADRVPASGELVEFSILFAHSSAEPLRVHCAARVIRIDKLEGEFGIAAVIEKFLFATLHSQH